MYLRLTIPLFLFLCIYTSCKNPSSKNSNPQNQIPVVCVVNYPLEYFAGRIGGEHIQVEFPVPQNIDPAYWKPDSSDIEKFQTADVILLNGADYAKWTSIASLPGHKLVDTSENFQDSFIRIEKSFVHRHGPKGEQSAKDIAFTTWMDFHLAELQAKTILDALSEIMPNKKDELEKNFEALANDLRQLDANFKKTMEKAKGIPVVFARPIYQYLSKRYELNSETVAWDPSLVPDQESLGQLEVILKKHPAKWMIWNKTPNEETTKILKEKYSITSIVIDPMSNREDGSPDWLTSMNSNLDVLKSLK